MEQIFSAWKTIKYSLWLVMAATFALSLKMVAGLISGSGSDLSARDVLCIGMECLTIGLLCLMFFGNLLRDIHQVLTIYFSVIVFLMCPYLLCDSGSIYLNGRSDHIALLWMLNSLIYAGPIILLLSFWPFVREWLCEPMKFTKWEWAAAANAAFGLGMVVCNYFTKFYFYVDNGGFYHSGSLSVLSLISPFFSLLMIWLKVLKSSMELSEKLIFMSFPLTPLVVGALSAGGNGSDFIAISIFVSVFFIYCTLFVQRERKLEENMRQLQEKTTEIMLTQIQPHFLYNTLSVIAYLCDHDSKKAKQTISQFSDYLRMNMDSLHGQPLVPFAKELEHTRTYLSIEMLRFGDILNVEYDIQCTDFIVPALSLQPLVENAVKHGIRGKEDGGTVKISTRKEKEKVIVTIADDGIGFDPEQLGTMNQSSDPKERSHIGLKNARERIETIGRGTFSLQSKIGEGTKITITFENEA